jgi:hypothetical protein
MVGAAAAARNASTRRIELDVAKGERTWTSAGNGRLRIKKGWGVTVRASAASIIRRGESGRSAKVVSPRMDFRWLSSPHASKACPHTSRVVRDVTVGLALDRDDAKGRN